MSTPNSKRPVMLLSVSLMGGALLLLIGGLGLYPRWAKHRDRVRALDDFATGLDETTLEYERCITATDEPSAYGRSILEQLRTRDFDGDYQPAVNACADNYERRIEKLRKLVDARFGPLGSPFHFYNLPELARLCSELESSRNHRSRWLADLELSREPLPEFDCRVPEVAVRPLAPRNAAKEWDVWELPSGELLIADGPLNGDRRYAHVKSDGAMTWFIPPSGLEHYPFAFYLTAKQPFLLNYPQKGSKLMLGTWLGSPGDPEQFEQRPLEGGSPSIVITSPERWVFVDDQYDFIELRISDDDGKSFTTVRVQYPRQFEERAKTSQWGYLRGKQLFLLVVREFSASETEAQPSLVFVVRVDEAGRASTSSIDYEHVHRAINISSCATPNGAFATIGNHLVLHIDDAPTIAHDFEPAGTGTLACQGEHAFVFVNDPSVGLQRYVCSDQDCGDPALLTTLDSTSSLRSTAEGVRAVLLTGKGGDVDLHVVDEPLGGPIERIERLVRDDQLENGWLDGQDLPCMIDGHLYATSVRAREFSMKSPRAAANAAAGKRAEAQ